jgi:hypothetical protein
LLIGGYQGMKQRESSIPPVNRPDLRQSGAWIAQLFDRWKKPSEAAEWRRKLEPPRVQAAAQ